MADSVSPAKLPPWNIPSSDSVVKVSVIDTTTRVRNIPTSAFFTPIIGENKFVDCPAYSFLIEHEGLDKKIIFDLGVPKNWRSGPPVLVNRIIDNHWRVDVTKNVADILVEQGLPLHTISSIIWSHYHWDHTGDPSTFPPTTSLVVGPGFKKALTPGYPTNPTANILESAYSGRELVEISFEGSTKLSLGRFPAIDYFGDGSFYLLDSPGHAIGHICGLARTTPDTFVLMGGDICHHGGMIRPTEYLPLPEYISPNPFKPHGPPCPGSILLDIHPEASATKPFYKVARGASYHDVEESERSIDKLEELDAHPNIFTIVAHDQTLLDVIDVYPHTINDWHAKGYKERTMWRFIKDFEGAVKSD